MSDEKSSIAPETLQQWLAEGRKITILDIRKNADRSEWFIPGSIHIDAYDALKAGDPNALRDINLPTDIPVVTVCGVGKTACVAAEQLKAQGIEAMPLEGGMKDWSSAWNLADITNESVQVVQFRRTGKGCLSYLVASKQQAVVIDASIDPKHYFNVARSRGWKITHVLDTHLHADHLSRGLQLAALANGEVLLPSCSQVLFPFTPIHDKDEINIGSVVLRAIHTPGHTDESMSYLLDRQNVVVAPLLFTGDTLFVNGVGRPDLGLNADDIAERSSVLYQSLQKLLGLDPDTLVLPGHYNAPIPFDSHPISSPLSELRKKLSLLTRSEADFIECILKRIPVMPPSYLRIVNHNKDGTYPDEEAGNLEAGGNRCAVS